MSDIRLPQRPMVELPPPVDGLDRVRGEAGQRRRRRAGLVGAGLTTAAAVAVVLALSGGPGGIAVLKPAPPAAPGFVQPTPTGTGAVGVAAAAKHHYLAAHQSTVRAHAAGPAGSHSAPSGRDADTLPRPADPVPQSHGQVSRTQQPQLTRWQSTYTESPARQCSGSTYGDGGGTLESSVGWCLDVYATPVSDGVRLHIRLCRDSTGGGTLSFASTREVDLAVSQGTKTIWDWASSHPGSSDAHQMSEPANGCMNWALVWPAVTTAGGPAGHGDFTFVGTSDANEMQGHPSESVNFAY